MKSYTDIKQSKKLAEILPIDSADQTWERIAIAGANLDVPEEMEYWHNGNIPYTLSSRGGVPCWSLAALLNLLPSVITRNGKRMFLTLEKAGAYNLYYKSPDRLDELWETKEDAIDACYELILKLHEQKTDPCTDCTNDKGCVTCEHGELRETTTRTLNPDKVIEWMKTHGNLWPRVTIKINEVIDKFKQDFDL